MPASLSRAWRGATRWRLLPVLVLCLAAAAPAGGCTGDCGGDGVVSADELVRGVGIALGRTALDRCPAFDRDGDGAVTVDELLLAVNALLVGCPAPSPTPTASITPSASPSITASPSPSATGTETPTESASPTATPTPTFNLPPALPARLIYRTYPGFAVAVPLASDPEGGALQCLAEELPAGASLDGALLAWTPGSEQTGVFSVPFSCADDGSPPLATDGHITLKVSPLDACARPSCDPAAGCVAGLPDVREACCADAPAARLPDPDVGCPEGRVVFVGRNALGFGRLVNCDVMRVINRSQAGASITFHVEARCLDTTEPVEVRVRLETKDRLLVDDAVHVQFGPPESGFARKRNVGFEVGGPAPFFDIEGAEANLRVTLTDSDGVSATEQLRVRLTFTRVADVPESDVAVAPLAAAAGDLQ